MTHKVRTVIVELEYPMDSDDDYLVNGIADEHYGVGRELVRCKDCKHYWESAGMCTNAELPVNNSIEPNDYCSRAERGTDEE